MISLRRSVGISLKRMSKKVLVTLTCLPEPSGEVPMPWKSRPSSFEYDSFQILWKSGCWHSWRYSSDWPVDLSRTGRDHLLRRAEEYVRLEAARAKTGIAGYARERVREATGCRKGVKRWRWRTV